MDICVPDTTDWACYGTMEEVEELDPVIRETAEKFAWTALSRLTGFRLSLCPVTIQPCARRCSPPVWETAVVGVSDTFAPFLRDGRWYNACGCSAPDTCRCTSLPEVVLPSEASGPLVVKVGGAVVDPSAYRVENGNRLVRIDGGTWPLCPDDATPTGPPTWGPETVAGDADPFVEGEAFATATRVGDVVTYTITGTLTTNYGGATFLFSEPFQAPYEYHIEQDWPLEIGGYETGRVFVTARDTVTDHPLNYTGRHYANPTSVEPNPATTGPFEVTYYPGVGPDELLSYAAGMLAAEYYKSCQGKECRLPANITGITRQGVSFQVAADAFGQGLSGIREVDDIVAIYNPFRLQVPPRVMSPSTRRSRMRTA